MQRIGSWPHAIYGDNRFLASAIYADNKVPISVIYADKSPGSAIYADNRFLAKLFMQRIGS